MLALKDILSSKNPSIHSVSPRVGRSGPLVLIYSGCNWLVESYVYFVALNQIPNISVPSIGHNTLNITTHKGENLCY